MKFVLSIQDLENFQFSTEITILLVSRKIESFLGFTAAQPTVVVPQRSVIERMEKCRPMDFLRKKDDEPSMVENWLERTERMLRQMHCTPEENLERATSLLQDEAYQWWVYVTRTA